MKRHRLELREYQTISTTLTPTAARSLQAAGAGRITVGISGDGDAYVVTAAQWVGTVVADEVEIVVRPKVSLHNLFSMLDVPIPPGAWSGDDVELAEDPDLLAAIASWFARLADQALARGVRRDYVRMNDRLPAMRGRIDFPTQLRAPALELPLACEFDEFTADIVENRVLKAAARRLLRVPMVRPEVRGELHRLLIALEEVSDAYVDVEHIDRIVITRLNRHYQPALALARLILRDVSLIDRLGSTPSSSFMLDMNALFQTWVTDRLRRHLRGRLVVKAEPRGWHLDVDGRVRIEPDLVFIGHGGGVVGVGDVKYKITESGLGRTGDYYQLLAYTTARHLPRGVLVYCQGDATPVPSRLTVLGSGKHLHARQLDLTGDGDRLEQSARDLANEIDELFVS